jgi:hypothetical protein
MRLRALLLVLGAFVLVSGTAHAVDRGQFENVPDDIRAWFKGVRSPAGIPCCDISDGHRTEYEVRAGAYWVPINGLWWQVPEKAIIRNAGNPLGEAVVWYVSLRGRSRSAASSRPMPRERCADTFSQSRRRSQWRSSFPAFWYLSKVIAFCYPSPPL